jgi:hypothetical protein
MVRRRILGLGWEMDSTALHALIAAVPGTTAAVEAEQKVASATAELAQQYRIQPDAKPAQQIRAPIASVGNSGWLPAG